MYKLEEFDFAGQKIRIITDTRTPYIWMPIETIFNLCEFTRDDLNKWYNDEDFLPITTHLVKVKISETETKTFDCVHSSIFWYIFARVKKKTEFKQRSIPCLD